MQAFSRTALMAAFVALGLAVFGSVTKDHSAMAQSAAKPVTTSSGLQYIDGKAGATIAKLAQQFDTDETHVVNNLIRFALANRNWDGLGIGGWPDVEKRQTRYAIRIPRFLSLLAYHDPNAVVRGLDAEGVQLDDIELRAPTLDDVFLAKTGRTLEGAAESEKT